VSDSRERLQKALARAGIGSRRAVEDLIAARRVSVNGTIARLGDRVDPGKDKVEVDGFRVQLATDLVYYLMNKPEGVVTSAHDPEGRPTVTDLVEVGTRVWPVGRLDMDTEGALLLTNDGELTQHLTHPSHGVPKTYLAEVGGTIGRRALTQLRAGIVLEDGPACPAEAHVVERLAGASLVEITVTEGRNRQVRRMLEHVGHPVRRLVRTAIGPLMLGRLRAGRVRRLGPAEVRALYRACGL
jgi:23S rRNA pseudouridine2605 synthase